MMIDMNLGWAFRVSHESRTEPPPVDKLVSKESATSGVIDEETDVSSGNAVGCGLSSEDEDLD